LLSFNKLASNPLNLPFKVEISEVFYSPNGTVSENLIKKRVFDENTSTFLSEFVQKQPSNFKRFSNDNKLNNLGFRFSSLQAKYLRVQIIFNDVPLFPLCQVTKDTLIELTVIGEPGYLITQEENDFVWQEFENLHGQVTAGNLEVSEDEMLALVSQGKGVEEATESNANKDVEIKKTLDELQTIVVNWQDALRGHLNALDLAEDSELLKEKIDHINSLCVNITQAQSTVQGYFDYYPHKDVKNNLDFWLKFFDHLSSTILTQKLHTTLALEVPTIQDIFEYISLTSISVKMEGVVQTILQDIVSRQSVPENQNLWLTLIKYFCSKDLIGSSTKRSTNYKKFIEILRLLDPDWKMVHWYF
jgi:hypothetical protein